MGLRITDISAFGFGVGWEKTASDAVVARAVIHFLENRMLLFGVRHMEDERFCVLSAIECRNFLTEQMGMPGVGSSLLRSLRAMRLAMRQFVERGGPYGQNFSHRESYGTDAFSLALGELRSQVGLHVAAIAYQYKIEVEDDLATILPPTPREDDDSSDWMRAYE